MRFTSTFLLSLLASIATTADSSGSSKSTQKPCTLHSPTSGSYFDLTQIQVHPPTKSSSKEARVESWHSRGYDYGANFTINFCGPVVEELGKVEGLSESKVQNVSAFYRMDGKTYSIGQENSEPLFRGRKLVLNYTDGSPCSDGSSSSYPDEDDRNSSKARRKSTVLSFLCDRDPQYTDHPQISFIGTPDSCSYYFEVRSRAACGGASSQSPSSLGPGGVFGVILAIAICVYLIGGCAYQRTVMHQRGWRQCPNWAVWKGIADFLGDMIIIGFSSISRLFGSSDSSPFSFNRAFNTGGYHRVGETPPDSGNPTFGRTGGYGRGGATAGVRGGGAVGRGRDEEEENRLIDQLDEEWDD